MWYNVHVVYISIKGGPCKWNQFFYSILLFDKVFRIITNDIIMRLKFTTNTSIGQFKAKGVAIHFHHQCDILEYLSLIYKDEIFYGTTGNWLTMPKYLFSLFSIPSTSHVMPPFKIHSTLNSRVFQMQYLRHF